MSNKQKNKKKNKNTVKVTPLKIYLGIAVIALVVIGLSVFISYLTRDKYFVCTKYDLVQKAALKDDPNGTVTDNLLEGYEYYKFILNEDGKTFTLKYKVVDDKEDKEYIETGKYTITETETSKTLELEYDSYADTEPTIVKYKMNAEGTVLTRSQTINASETLRGTIVQSFVFK